MRRKTRTLYSYWRLCAILSVILTCLYVYQVNEMTRETYAIREYNRKAEMVLEQRRRAEYDFLSYNSLARIETLVEDRGFERGGNIHYIRVADTQMASK